MKNRGINLTLTNFVGVDLRKIYKKFEANPSMGLREVNNGIIHSDK